MSANGAGGLASGQPFFNDTASFATISAGAAIAAYSFLGFEAVTTLTEKTVNRGRPCPAPSCWWLVIFWQNAGAELRQELLERFDELERLEFPAQTPTWIAAGGRRG